jgi:PAS domain S-box-containing protein
MVERIGGERLSDDEIRALRSEVAALRERNATLEAVVEQMEEFFYVKDLEGRYLVVNSGGASHLGLSPRDVVGKVDVELFPPEVARRIVEVDRRIMAEGVSLTYEEVATTAGVTRTYRSTKWPYRDERGSIVGLIGVALDITEPRRAEEELRETREFLTRLLDHSPAHIYVLDRDGRLRLVNPACEELLGLRREEMIGRRLEEIYPPAQAARFREQHRRVFEAEVPLEFEEDVDARAGRKHFFTVKFPLRDATHRVVALGGISIDITERKRVEAILARDAMLLANVRDSVIVTDLDGIVTYWNEGATRLFGWRAEEMLGRLLLERVPPEARERMAAATRTIGEGAVFEGEWEDYRKDGSRIWIDARVARIADAGGQPIGIMGLAHDISDRKRAELALRESEERGRLLLESAGEAIIGLDPEGRCTFCNAAALRLFGYSEPREMLGRCLHGMIHHTRADGTPYPLTECRAHVAHLRAEGIHIEDEVLWRSDGTNFPAEYWSYPMRRDGEVVGAVVALVDISERRRVEEQLLAINAALENAVEGIARLDTQGRYVTVNRAYAAMLGYRPEELVGRDRELTIHPAHRGDVAAACRRMLAEDRAEVEVLGVRKDGSSFWKHVVLVTIRNPQGEWAGNYCFQKDITDRKRAEQALRRYARRLKVLSRRVVEVQEEERCHLARELHDEIGQSLTAIAVNLQAVRRSCGPDAHPRLEECLGIVQRGIEQVRSLALDLRPSMLDDLGLVAALRWYLDGQARRVGYEARFVARPEEIRLGSAAATIAFRVAQEALTNVARHARARRVLVKLWTRGGQLWLIVRDDGIGFDPEAALRRVAAGRGLGLLGMRERAALLGGRVDFRSVEGRGTEVRLALRTGDDEEGS